MVTKGIAILLGLGLLAGCGVATPVAQSPATTVPAASTLSIQKAGSKFDQLKAKLDLSTAQKQAIKQILTKFKQAKCDKVDAKGVIQEAMLAPEIDRDQLSAAIIEKISNRSDKIDAGVAVLTEIRNVLTPEQRAQFADMKDMKQSLHHGGHHHHGQDRMKRLTKELNLTEAQQAAFQKVGDAFKANKDAYRAAKAAKFQAICGFMVSGDADALKSALTAIPMQVPVAEMVDAAASLDQSQRQKLVDRMDARRAKWCAKQGQPAEAKGQQEDDSIASSDGSSDVVKASASDVSIDESQPAPANADESESDNK